MSDEMVPEPDVQEQEQPLAEPLTAGKPDTGIEVPEADAVEQAQPGPLDDDDGYPRD